MIMHKQKEAKTENFGSISLSKVADLLDKNDTSKKIFNLYEKNYHHKVDPLFKCYQFMMQII